MMPGAGPESGTFAFGGRRLEPATAFLAFFLLSVLLAAAIAFGLPHTVFHHGWLAGDQGWNLATLDQLLAGGRLYRDAATPYGPLPYAWQVWLADRLGNSPTTFFAGTALVASAATGLTGAFLTSRFGLRLALPAVVFGAVPFFFKTLSSSIFAPWAAVQVAVLLLVWRGPAESGRRACLLLGAVVGIGQWIKFGHFAILFPALAAVDLLLLGRHALSAAGLWLLVRRWLAIGAGFLLVEGALLGWLFSTLPAEIAADAAWPSYQMQAYGIFGPDERMWGGFWSMPWKPFLGRILPALALLALSLAGCRAVLRNVSVAGLPQAAAALLVPGLAYLAGLFLLFPTTNNVWAYTWLAGWLPAFLLLADRRRRWLRLAALGLIGGAFIAATVGWLSSSHRQGRPERMPDGSVLWLGEEQAASWRAVRELSSAAFPPGSTVQFLKWHGLAHFLKLQPPGRHAYPLPGWVRPHETAKLAQALQQAQAIVAPRHRLNDAVAAAVGPQAVAAAVASWSQLPAPYREAMLGLALIPEIRHGWLMLRIQSHPPLSAQP